MDHEALSHQARAAIDSLTLQLQALEAQQSALLTSLRLTTDSLSPTASPNNTTAIPNYHLISPTLSLIPAYTAKLTRLRNTMSNQTLEITQLRRRVEEVKRGRRRNLERVRERWERERERDRTVLRARMVGVGGEEEGMGGMGALTQKPQDVGEEKALISGGEDVTDAVAVAAAVPLPGTPAPPTPPMSPPNAQESGGIKVVRRKKKARQVEM